MWISKGEVLTQPLRPTPRTIATKNYKEREQRPRRDRRNGDRRNGGDRRQGGFNRNGGNRQGRPAAKEGGAQ